MEKINLQNIKNDESYTDLVYDFLKFLDIKYGIEHSTLNGVAFILLYCLNELFKEEKSFDDISEYVFTDKQFVDENYRLWLCLFLSSPSDIAYVLGESLFKYCEVINDSKFDSKSSALIYNCYDFLSQVENAEWDVKYARFLTRVTYDDMYFD